MLTGPPMPCTSAPIGRGVGDGRDEDAVGAGIEVRPASFDGALEPRRRVADLADEDVGARVEHERDVRVPGHSSHGGDLGDERIDGKQWVVSCVSRVLEIETDAARLDEPARGRGGVLRRCRRSRLPCRRVTGRSTAAAIGATIESICSRVTSCPSGYPRAFAAPALVVAIAWAPAFAITAALPASHALSEHERLAGNVE